MSGVTCGVGGVATRAGSSWLGARGVTQLPPGREWDDVAPHPQPVLRLHRKQHGRLVPVQGEVELNHDRGPAPTPTQPVVPVTLRPRQ